ncbi:MAG: ATP-dependent zinc metalloprotease FtsH [Bacteroidota bacterium]|nr:ATP-dependent zinc metalloprotease FtsH [Bacteroidota bacterium]MDP4242588.1 ATP-dependent zinc metalloprotease FtsH [Bacteroidota bacterium]
MSDQPTSSAERDAQPPAGAPPSAPPPTQNGKRRPVSAPQSGTPGTPGGSPQGGTPQGQRKPPQRKPQGGPNRRDEMDFGHIMRTVLLWAAMLLGVVVLVVIFNRSNNPTEVEISTSEYQRLLDEGDFTSGKVEQYGLTQYRFKGQLSKDMSVHTVEGTTRSAKNIVTNLIPETLSDQYKTWREKGVNITKTDSSNGLTDSLLSFLPWIVLIVAWIFIMRRMQGGQGLGGGTKGIFSFGRSRAKLVTEGAPKVTFNDVAGADEAKVELVEIIEFLREPAKFQKLGGKIPRGVLLLGPPGTGKTLLARAVAGEAGVPFLSISGADFVEMFVGVGASRVRDLFDQAKKHAPCIVFIDEIDAVGRHRGAGLGGGHDEREQTLNQLLVEMDGFEQNLGVIIVAATNRPDVLDPALLRPGRFDRQVVVDRPDVRGREGILKVHTRNTPLGPDVDLQALARGTPGLSGADLANLVNEAALLAARHGADRLAMYDFENAKDKVMMGVERKSVLISEEEKKTTAYHECGHVIVAKSIPEADPVHKVTIIPRGRALGVTSYLPVDEKHTYSREYLEAVIAYALGGRSAERIIFNQITTGAGNDIERATDIARKMVCEWGMSDKLGPLKYGQGEQEVFLGRDYGHQKTFSDTTARIIDEEIRHIVETGADRAVKILSEKIDVLHRMSTALLERETLDSGEIDVLMTGGELPPFDKENRMFNLVKAVENLKKASDESKQSGNGQAEPASSEKAKDAEGPGNVVGPGDKGDSL